LRFHHISASIHHLFHIQPEGRRQDERPHRNGHTQGARARLARGGIGVYGALTARVIRGRFAAMSRRDSGAVLRFFADDASFRYGGEHALAGEYRSREEIAHWFERLWSLFEVQFDVHDVLVGGPPWSMRVATRFTARVRAADGRTFVNHGMQYARIRWGRVREDHVYPDTQLVAVALEHARRCEHARRSESRLPTAGSAAQP
jgi:ketosteroid isomerase-like protein